MKKIGRILAFSLIVGKTGLWAQQVRVVKWPEVQKILTQKSDTTFIINFWATWCKPCVTELPFFESNAQHFSEFPVKIILVSQDAKTRSAQVSDFLKKNNYTSEAFILSAGNPNIWIDKIDNRWSGAIPMTLFYKNGNKEYFHEGEYSTAEELESYIHTKL
ncbi:MAG TPA: TlpA disulfide reductase family protein [Chitinophagales bacterium]|nr:TlpA disulfide reductase family protein [Chitinophagales bacterium]